MKKLNYVLCFFVVIILVFLYLLSSTDLILKEQVDTIYNISVIANDSNDEFFLNARMGMEQALKEWKADVSFVSLYERNNVEQQLELILKEIQNGAQAVLVCPVDSVELGELLDESVIPVPVICIGASVESPKASAVIRANDYERGRKLLEMISAEDEEMKGILMMTDSYEHSAIKELCEGIQDACRELQVKNDLLTYEGEEEFYSILENAIQSGSYGTFIGLDSQTLKLLANEELHKKNTDMCILGSGYSNRILRMLDQGEIAGLSIRNDYVMGYLGIKTAVNLLNGDNERKVIYVDDYTIGQKDVFDSKYQKILFPIF